MTATDLTLQWSIAALVGLLLFARGRLTLFHPATIYLVFHAVAFCLRPTLIVVLDLEATWKSIHLAPEPDLLRHALWVSSAGLVAFAVAFLLGTTRAPALRPAAPPEMDRSDRRALLVTGALVAVPGLASAAIGRSAAAYSAYVFDLQLMLLPITLLIILTTQWRWWSLLPFVTVVGMRAASSASVLPMVTAASLLILLLWLWSHQRLVPPFSCLAAGCAVAVGAFFLADHRAALADWVAGREVPDAPDGSEPTMADRLVRPELSHFEALTFIVDTVPEKSGAFSHGSQHFASWADATPATSIAGRISSGNSEAKDVTRVTPIRGLPTPLVADGWMSGGWPGLVTTLAVAGLLLGAAFVFFSHRQDDPVAACLLTMVQAFSLELYQAGDSTVVRGVLYSALPLLVWRFFANRFRRAGVAEAERERLREERQRRRLLGTALLNPNAAALPAAVLRPADAADTAEDLAPPIAEAPKAVQEAEPPPPAAPSDIAARPQARWRGDDRR